VDKGSAAKEKARWCQELFRLISKVREKSASIDDSAIRWFHNFRCGVAIDERSVARLRDSIIVIHILLL